MRRSITWTTSSLPRSLRALSEKADKTDEEVEKIASYEKNGPSPTSGFQRIVQRAILHVSAAGGDEVTGANVLVAMFSERESYAVYFLQQQDMSRLDAVTYISHGVGKGYVPDRETEPPPPKKTRAAKSRQGRRGRGQAAVAAAPAREAEAETPSAPSAASIRKIFRDDLRAVSDSVATEPVLNTPRIADKMVEFALELVDRSDLATSGPYGRRPLLTIGIYGPWGSGKSTLLRRIGTRMSDQRFVTVFVNTWKWGGDEDIFAFMNRELLKSLSRIKGMKWRANLVRALLFAKANSRRLVAWLAISAVLVIAYFSIDWYRSVTPENVKSSVLVLASGALIALVAKPLGSLVEKLILHDGEGSDARQSLSQSYRYLGLIRRMTRDKSRMADDRSQDLPIVFLFDDLDRCDDVKVVEFIKSIHSLTADGSICVLACDEQFAAAAIYNQFKAVADYLEEGKAFGARFLEKIIQLPFRLPEVSPEDLVSLGLMPGASPAPAGAPGLAVEPEGRSDAPSPPANVRKDLEPASPVSEAKLSEICGATLALIVEPCCLQIRQAKMLSNVVKLYSMIFPPVDEASAERLAAFLIASYVDEYWIPRKYFSHGEAAAAASPLDAIEPELRRRLGDDVAALERFYRLYGIRRPKPPATAAIAAATSEEQVAI